MGLKISPLYLYQPHTSNQQNISFTGKINYARKVQPEKMLSDFSQYNPNIKNFFSKIISKYKIPVHNPKIQERLRSTYTSAQFKELYDFAKSKGTFDYVMNEKTGLVKTSFIHTEENKLHRSF